MEANTKKKLLLHVCCAPCATHVIKTLIDEYELTLFFYNPNITLIEEFEKRYNELVDYIKKVYYEKNIKIIKGNYEKDVFLELSKGKEKEPERGARCFLCYELRLEETAKLGEKNKIDLFTSTLSVSPYKNSEWLNIIGIKLEKKYNISYLVSDFKKKNGYVNSVKTSKEFGLYRQNYCGCIFSKKSMEKKQDI